MKSKLNIGNLFADIPDSFSEEQFSELFSNSDLRIERILSKGHTAPKSGWFEQNWDEWVVVIRGAAILAFEDGSEVQLSSGDHIDIPANLKHRVTWTDPDQQTIWIAVHNQRSTVA